MDAPSLRRRLISNVYESLLLIAVLFIAALPIAALTQYLPPQIGIVLLRIYLVGISGVYFVLFWRQGQTLAMKTWRIRMVAADGGMPTTAQAWLRFALSVLNLLLLGAGWWAALIRRDGQFLQDHFAGTRLIRQ